MQMPEITASTPNFHVKKAISLLGGYAATARLLGLTRSAIHQWGVRRCPAEQVLRLCGLVEYEITPEQLRPDVFADPDVTE